MATCAPYVAMIIVSLAYGGSNILTKVALEKGLNQLVFVAYRHIIGMILLGPFAYVLERRQRPSLTLPLLLKIFIVSTLGTTIYLNVFFAGLAYTSATVASALNNVIPSSTFIMAVLLRMEVVKFTRAAGWAKVLGTLICIGGSLIFTFWRGGYLYKSLEDRPLINMYSTTQGTTTHEFRHPKENWIKGVALIITSNVGWSACMILQGVLSKDYPAPLSLTTWMCFFGSAQSSFLALLFARNIALWKLEWNVQLFTIIYCGVVISAFVYYLQYWCISVKGPVFASMFSPLVVVIVAIFSAIAFAERLHVGSFIGGALIIAGFYCVLWGKRQDASSHTSEHKEDEMNVLSSTRTTIEVSIDDCACADPVITTSERQ
ncbi:hypothetical protein Tsubulata_022857 [Turnera subulata]|uniref:WAT1-related protein n=1 Tax=Turnera subulata TaxID=218843 RepID=A0A9Q0FCA9_9ROSI|nr:hypothetical protein Tsubulata_022857 [Turnera subulata]